MTSALQNYRFNNFRLNSSARKLAGGMCLSLSAFFSTNDALASVWSTTNLQYHYGNDFELGDETRSVVTLEHASGWAYGDNFFFVDITNPDRKGENTGTEFYGEISPRLSLGKLTDTDLSYGIIKDLLITTTIEMGDAGTGFHNNLYGLAADLNLPGFAFFQVNLYIRNEVTFDTDLGQQVTLAWALPFALGSANFSFEGFLDYAWGNSPSEDNIVSQPRLLLDVGSFWSAPKTLYVGTEYQIWRNKFGIDGVNESFPDLMVKWNF